MGSSRREFALGAAAAALARAQSDVELPEMVFRYFARRLAALPHGSNIRETLRRLSGPYPPPCPLDAHVTRTIARDGYRIENLLFQSRPDFRVSANFYLPAGTPPFPAIVMPRGHFDAERMTGDYQQMHFDLALAGFAVLAFDPIGQGERRQQWAEPFDSLFSTTLEHALVGNLLALLGESAAGWQVWDGMRAVDYLVSRPEVDPRRIGCADHPDNGSEAVLLCALDERIACAALHAPQIPRRFPPDRATWTIPDDTVEYLFGAARAGIDTVDLFAALAPRPLLLLAEAQQGGLPALAGRYAADRLAVERAQPGTDWPSQLRLAAVRWFARWFGRGAGPHTEAGVIPEPLASLRASPRPVGKSVYTLIREQAAHIPPAAAPAEVRERLRRLVAPPAAAPAAAVRTLAPDRLQLPSEPGIWLPTDVHRPARPNGKVVVYVAGDVTAMPADEDDEAPAADETPARLASQGYLAFAVDVRGIGRSSPALDRRPLRVPSQHLLNPDMMLNFLAWSLGDSLFAMRVRDLLRAVDYAARFGPVRVAGRDMGALWALAAAALDPRIEAVATQRGLASWRSLIECGRYRQASSQIMWGVLREFDLPQVAAAIAPRPLALVDPAGPDRRPLAPAAAESAYAVARAAYRAHHAESRFRIAFGQPLGEAWG